MKILLIIFLATHLFARGIFKAEIGGVSENFHASNKLNDEKFDAFSKFGTYAEFSYIHLINEKIEIQGMFGMELVKFDFEQKETDDINVDQSAKEFFSGDDSMFMPRFGLKFIYNLSDKLELNFDARFRKSIFIMPVISSGFGMGFDMSPTLFFTTANSWRVGPGARFLMGKRKRFRFYLTGLFQVAKSSISSGDQQPQPPIPSGPPEEEGTSQTGIAYTAGIEIMYQAKKKFTYVGILKYDAEHMSEDTFSFNRRSFVIGVQAITRW